MPAAAASAVVLGDQLTKGVVTRSLGPQEGRHRHDVLGDLLAFHYVENTGLAFGLMRGRSGVTTILVFVVLLLFCLVYLRRRAVATPAAVGCGLVIGGAIGNLTDRVRLGYVIDFVAVSSWPKFNVADTAITIGACLLAWTSLGIRAFVNTSRRRTGAGLKRPEGTRRSTYEAPCRGLR